MKDFADGFEDVLSRYREIVPHLRLAGYDLTIFLATRDTLFTPVIIFQC